MNKVLEIFKNQKFRLTLGLIFLFELLSLSGYLVPEINQLVFVVLSVLFLVIALKNLNLAFWLVILELIIGSKGYLFYFDVFETQISIRIAWWIILMSVWFYQEIYNFWQNKKISWPFSYYRYYWLALLIFIVLGLLVGVGQHNDPSNLFLDFNNWLYLLIVLPAYRLLNQENYKKYWSLLLAALSWLVIKTLLLLFAFSHNVFLANTELYRWVRTTGIAEVTEMTSGFYRIFFQSHIYVILAFIGVLFLFTQALKAKKRVGLWFGLLVLLASVSIITLSRSFAVGLVVGLVIYWLVSLFYFKLNWQQLIITNLTWLMSVVLGLSLIFAIVKFPYPQPWINVSLSDLLAERTNVSDEAAATSRWSLLPELWGGISLNPVLGQGFGAVITYETDDPRIRQSSADGLYTTYAFEWGWLDIWFKLGLGGLLVYVIFLGKLAWDGLATKKLLGVYLASGLLIISAIHFFTPYLNHPLGLGLVAVSAVLIDLLRQQSTLAK